MKDHLKISIPKIAEHTIERENFTTIGLDQYTLGTLLLEKIQSDAQFDVDPIKFNRVDLYHTIKAMGILPLGEKGHLEYNRVLSTVNPIIKALEEIKIKTALSSFSAQIQFDEALISVNFSDIKEDGKYYVGYGKLTSARLLSGWIRHLFLNHGIQHKDSANKSALDNYPRDTFLIGRDPKGKKEVSIYQFSAIESDTKQIIEKLLTFYANGITEPLYFFCETSWQFVQAISRKEFKTDHHSIKECINKSKRFWDGNDYLMGEKSNRYIERCIENNDPFDSVDKLVNSGFVDNSIQIYKPMMEHMKILA